MNGRFSVVGCSRCGARRVVEEGRKTAQCQRCPATIELAHAARLFSSSSLEEAQAFMGAAGAREAGDLGRFAREVKAGAPPRNEREKERLAIAEALSSASGRANQLKLILRRGFEAFGEVTEADLDAIALTADLALTGAELADAAVELGLAGRSKSGALIPLRQGR